MTNINKLHDRWMNDPQYQHEYELLDTEFELAKVLILARKKAGINQQELAKRMKTKQSVIARLESAEGNPTIKTLTRYAEALGGHLQINIT